MKTLLIKSYAKINLCLDITNKRSDGYHELDMVMVPIELHDSLLLTLQKNAPDNYVTVDDFSLGALDYNLATFAIDKLATQYNFNEKFRLLIHKVIPVQAGLGGGSSNAAFTLKGVNNLLKLNISDDELMNISKSLGADIPFFIKCVPSRCQGIGDVLSNVIIKDNYYAVVVKPHAGCSTKEIYSLYDEMITNGEIIQKGSVDNVVKALENGDDDLLASSMFNVLESPAIKLVPEIQHIKDALKGYGLKIVQMSGSGSAVFGLSKDKKLLKKIEKDLEEDYVVEVTKVLK